MDCRVKPGNDDGEGGAPPLFAVLFAIRAGIEGRALIAGLPDYADYAARVRYRLFPGFW
jgi:protein-S-isoprenylcysteine O-methyltransferase Ste14